MIVLWVFCFSFMVLFHLRWQNLASRNTEARSCSCRLFYSDNQPKQARAHLEEAAVSPLTRHHPTSPTRRRRLATTFCNITDVTSSVLSSRCTCAVGALPEPNPVQTLKNKTCAVLWSLYCSCQLLSVLLRMPPSLDICCMCCEPSRG